LGDGGRRLRGPRLQPTAPCIDAGSNASVPTGTTTDLSGKTRILDYPGVHTPGAIVDIGAYERLTDAATVTGTVGNDTYYVRNWTSLRWRHHNRAPRSKPHIAASTCLRQYSTMRMQILGSVPK
jgi:hypothetical protein